MWLEIFGINFNLALLNWNEDELDRNSRCRLSVGEAAVSFLKSPTHSKPDKWTENT